MLKFLAERRAQARSEAHATAHGSSSSASFASDMAKALTVEKTETETRARAVAAHDTCEQLRAKPAKRKSGSPPDAEPSLPACAEIRSTSSSSSSSRGLLAHIARSHDSRPTEALQDTPPKKHKWRSNVLAANVSTPNKIALQETVQPGPYTLCEAASTLPSEPHNESLESTGAPDELTSDVLKRASSCTISVAQSVYCGMVEEAEEKAELKEHIRVRRQQLASKLLGISNRRTQQKLRRRTWCLIAVEKKTTSRAVGDLSETTVCAELPGKSSALLKRRKISGFEATEQFHDGVVPRPNVLVGLPDRAVLSLASQIEQRYT